MDRFLKRKERANNSECKLNDSVWEGKLMHRKIGVREQKRFTNGGPWPKSLINLGSGHILARRSSVSCFCIFSSFY